LNNKRQGVIIQHIFLLYSMNSILSEKKKLSVIGAGAWGTALANLLAKKNHQVNLWVYEKDLCRIIEEKRENVRYFPGTKLSENITPFFDLEEAVSTSVSTVIIVVPSQHVRGILKALSSFLPEDVLIVSASKGIENGTLSTISQIYREEFSSRSSDAFAVISGPSFAREISDERPSAVVAASIKRETAKHLQELFSTHYFRIFLSSDVIGVELGGALKNVIAIAAGISDGLGNGYNSRAALITRGLAEMIRIGNVMGAKPQTLAGLSGMGDLILTCTGELSRNRTLGLHIGKGKSLKEIQKEMITVAEGVATVKSAHNLIEKHNIHAAIIKETYCILYENKHPHQAMRDLMKLHPSEEF